MELWVILGVVVILASWWYLAGVREIAYKHARRHCEKVGVQLLDQSVMTNGFRLARNRSGFLVPVQRFRFEFSTTGDTRYSGRLSLLGAKLLDIELDAHKID